MYCHRSGLPTRSFGTLSRLRCRVNGCHPRRRLLSFSQNIVHEVHHVSSGHSHAVAYEFASIVRFRLDVGFKFFDKSLGFLFRTLSAMTASTRSTAAVPAASVSAASLAVCFFLCRPVLHHGHSCRLLRAHISFMSLKRLKS